MDFEKKLNEALESIQDAKYPVAGDTLAETVPQADGKPLPQSITDLQGQGFTMIPALESGGTAGGSGLIVFLFNGKWYDVGMR